MTDSLTIGWSPKKVAAVGRALPRLGGPPCRIGLRVCREGFAVRVTECCRFVTLNERVTDWQARVTTLVNMLVVSASSTAADSAAAGRSLSEAPFDRADD